MGHGLRHARMMLEASVNGHNVHEQRAEKEVHLKWTKVRTEGRYRGGFSQKEGEKKKLGLPMYKYVASSPNYTWEVTPTLYASAAKWHTKMIGWAVYQFDKGGNRTPLFQGRHTDWRRRESAMAAVEQWVAEHDAEGGHQVSKRERMIHPRDLDAEFFNTQPYQKRAKIPPYGTIDLIGRLTADGAEIESIDVIMVDSSGVQTLVDTVKDFNFARLRAREAYKSLLDRDGVDWRSMPTGRNARK